jgi:hypothetical protein
MSKAVKGRAGGGSEAGGGGRRREWRGEVKMAVEDEEG